MAWTLLRPSPAQRLNRIKDWEDRGLTYWRKRALHCHDRVMAAESGATLGRAIADRDVALEAIRQLGG